jgi:hypothetical protein
MKLTFIEIASFTESITEYFGSDSAYAGFQQALINDAIRGQVMQGCGGLRKVRWPDSRRRKGKRGGLRIIYLEMPEIQTVVFYDIYDKNETDDLTPDARKSLTEIAKAVRAEALKNRRK